jgi:hypothetical protein
MVETGVQECTMGKIQVNDPIRPLSVDLRAAQAVICICGPSRNGTMRFLVPASAKSSCSTHPRRP